METRLKIHEHLNILLGRHAADKTNSTLDILFYLLWVRFFEFSSQFIFLCTLCIFFRSAQSSVLNCRTLYFLKGMGVHMKIIGISFQHHLTFGGPNNKQAAKAPIHHTKPVSWPHACMHVQRVDGAP